VASDAVVLVPDIASAYQSRMRTADLSSAAEVAIFDKLQRDVQEAGIGFTNGFSDLRLELPEPSLDDTMPDTDERLSRGVREALGCETVELPYYVVKRLARQLREDGFRVRVTGERRENGFFVYDVLPYDDRSPMCACAVDIGTTTVAAVLADLTTGRLLAKASSGNGQIRYGADVINRIIEQSKPGGVKKLQDAVIHETLVPIVAAMCRSAGVKAPRILRVSVASNTTMNHLLLGVDANPVRMEPYIPTFFPVARAVGARAELPGPPRRRGAAVPQHRLLRRRRHHGRRVLEPHLEPRRIFALHRPRHERRDRVRQPRLSHVLRLLRRPRVRGRRHLLRHARDGRRHRGGQNRPRHHGAHGQNCRQRPPAGPSASAAPASST
jgi:hypothetical protein